MSAAVTHANLEGQAGAIAIAVAAALVAAGGGAEEMFDAVLEFTPDSETRMGVSKAKRLSRSHDVRTAVSALGNGLKVISQDTVPFALWCVAGHLDSFEEALWKTVSGLGDRDTTCAIVGGIVSLAENSQGIPKEWESKREDLAVFVGVGYWRGNKWEIGG